MFFCSFFIFSLGDDVKSIFIVVLIRVSVAYLSLASELAD